MTPEILPLPLIPRRKPDIHPRELFVDRISNNPNLSYIDDSESEQRTIVEIQ